MNRLLDGIKIMAEGVTIGIGGTALTEGFGAPVAITAGVGVVASGLAVEGHALDAGTLAFSNFGGNFDNYVKYSSGGGSSPNNEIRHVYDSIKKAPNYPEGFKAISTTKNNIKNREVLEELRKVESGQWKKIYKDGYDVNGKKISIHYFQSQSGKVFNVKVKKGWSNNI